MEPNHADRPLGQQPESSTSASRNSQALSHGSARTKALIGIAACAALGLAVLTCVALRKAHADDGASPWRRIAQLIGLEPSHYDDYCGHSADARAGQVTTMVIRFNQFHPGGAKAIPLVDGGVYYPEDLEGLVIAGYCATADLQNHVDQSKGWIWSDTTRRFTPEQ